MPIIFGAIASDRWPQVKLLLAHCYNLNWANEWGTTAASAALPFNLAMAYHFVEQGLTHNLLDLARILQRNNTVEPEEKALRERLQRRLEERHGIFFPVPKRKSSTIHSRPSPPAFAQSCDQDAG